ncbi:MAG: outer membrane protein assembly factor BamD, partial [Acidobacteriaceae bacterium]
MDFTGFFLNRKAGWAAGVAVATMLTGVPMLSAQDAAAPQAAATQTAAPADATDGNATPTQDRRAKAKKSKVKVRETKDTRRLEKTESRTHAQVKRDTHVSKEGDLPDKQLFDKAKAQQKSGHYDVARLDLQTLLNTYPESQYLMKAKLAVADCWYHEGGTAGLAQAEQEYTDFITFFPNAPEAAEAQIRVGDIYFKQMDVPDRDYIKATKAEEAYRTMLKQYPDAPAQLLAEDRQKLREVQELLATRELSLGEFYASHENYPASIARYKTVVDNYPQYSHLDDALIGVGDGYAAEARLTRTQVTCGPNVKGMCLPEAAKAQILEEFDGKAAAAYRRVVLEHAASPHVEDAKERLAEMNLPIPTPTAEQVQVSEALESSRSQYTIAKRLQV